MVTGSCYFANIFSNTDNASFSNMTNFTDTISTVIKSCAVVTAILAIFLEAATTAFSFFANTKSVLAEPKGSFWSNCSITLVFGFSMEKESHFSNRFFFHGKTKDKSNGTIAPKASFGFSKNALGVGKERKGSGCSLKKYRENRGYHGAGLEHGRYCIGKVRHI